MVKKQKGIDVLYIVRPQVERWSLEELEKYSGSLLAAKVELERRESDKKFYRGEI